MIFEEERDYALIAASQTKAKLGPTGHIGDILVSITIVPETAAAGTVSIFDATGGTQIDIFKTGTLTDLRPFTLHFRMRSLAGGWLVTTGANVHVICTGRFT